MPRVGPIYSQQSAKSVYPLLIANFKENRLVNYNFLHYMYIIIFFFPFILIFFVIISYSSINSYIISSILTILTILNV